MPSRINSLLLTLLLTLPAAAGWREVLSSIGLTGDEAVHIIGASPEARATGVTAQSATVIVRSAVDAFAPHVQIVWEKEEEIPVYALPQGARIFTRERWSGAPIEAGWRDGDRVLLWTATEIGGRYPYLLQALLSLGVAPRVESRSLWAFFDSSYRLRADPEYLARRWRAGGVAALHVAAWHYWEPDAARDAWLKQLIETCHRHAILVYAWIEFPHVSEHFWDAHPEWREQTATGQDAHLDWRKLMNFADPACAAAAHAGLRALVARFDWDGINLGEFYFESLEGYQNPARFTPFNTLVRKEFQREHGFDPSELFEAASPRSPARDPAPMRLFLDFRAGLARRLQTEWLARMARLRRDKPGLDMVLTHIDDRFDPTMRDKLGVDAAHLLPEAEAANATFLIEDPATIWHLDAGRYREIARRYAPLAGLPGSFAIDLNIVERYQDVYPTRQQTGVELFELVHAAAQSFPRVALYSENSIQTADWPLLSASAAAARQTVRADGIVEVESRDSVALRWGPGCAEVDGRRWPVGGDALLLPAGYSRIEPCAGAGDRPLLDFNGTLLDARVVGGDLILRYRSTARAIAVLNEKPARALLLPAGLQEVRCKLAY
jgi:hypothetical protein